MHSNPQGAVWYPIARFFGMFGGYGIYQINLELVFHIVVGGIGTYFLLSKHINNKKVQAIGALVYSLSGFVSSTSHMIGFTAGAAWLPWCLFFLVQAYEKRKLLPATLLGLFTYLNLTGAYPAFSIVLAYIYIGYAIFYILSQENKKQAILTSMRVGIMSGITTLLLAAPFLYSIYDSLEYFNRAGGIPYDTKNFEGNFGWQAFQSLIVPYVISAKEGFKNLDVGMSNLYVGTTFLLFSLLYFFTKHKNKLLFGFLLLLSIAIGLGNNTPVHQFFFQYILGFSHFRHPYLFMLYAVLLLSIIGSISVQKNINLYNKNTYQALVIYVLLLVAIFIISLTQINYEHIDEFVTNIKMLREETVLNNYGHAAIQLFLCIVLLSFSILLYKRKNKFWLIFIVAEMIVSVQLNSPMHMYYNAPFDTLSQYLDSTANSALTNQNADTPLKSINNSAIQPTPGFWVNLNTYTRTTGLEGYNPFLYCWHENIKKQSYYHDLINEGIVVADNSETIVDSFEIGYNTFSIRTQNTVKDTIILHQNYHHNWKAYMNNKACPISKTHMGHMAVTVPSGHNKINFLYDSQVIRLLHSLSNSLLLLIIIGLLVRSTLSRNNTSKEN